MRCLRVVRCCCCCCEVSKKAKILYSTGQVFVGGTSSYPGPGAPSLPGSAGGFADRWRCCQRSGLMYPCLCQPPSIVLEAVRLLHAVRETLITSSAHACNHSPLVTRQWTDAYSCHSVIAVARPRAPSCAVRASLTSVAWTPFTPLVDRWSPMHADGHTTVPAHLFSGEPGMVPLPPAPKRSTTSSRPTLELVAAFLAFSTRIIVRPCREAPPPS